MEEWPEWALERPLLDPGPMRSDPFNERRPERQVAGRICAIVAHLCVSRRYHIRSPSAERPRGHESANLEVQLNGQRRRSPKHQRLAARRSASSGEHGEMGTSAAGPVTGLEPL